jgi:hypothetical protein
VGEKNRAHVDTIAKNANAANPLSSIANLIITHKFFSLCLYQVGTCTFAGRCTFKGMPNASFCDWIEREFKHVQLGDRRLNKRLQQIAADLSQNPQASIPQAAGTWARTKGAYRFFDHAGVSPEVILGGHQLATLDRNGREKDGAAGTRHHLLELCLSGG